METPRVQVAYAVEAFREGWRILRQWPALWFAILAGGVATLPEALESLKHQDSPGWLLGMLPLTGYVGTLISATMAVWVRGCVRGTLLPAKQVVLEVGRLWLAFLAFYVCTVAAGAGFGGLMGWMLCSPHMDGWGWFLLLSALVPLYVAGLIFMALVPGVILAKGLRGGLRLSFAFAGHFPVLVAILFAIGVVLPNLGEFVVAKMHHWSHGWFDNPLAAYPVLRQTVSSFPHFIAAGFLNIVQFVSVWKRWE